MTFTPWPPRNLAERSAGRNTEALPVDTPPLYCVIGPEGFPSRPEPVAGIKAALDEKAAFIERFRHQGYYAAIRYRIPISELADYVTIEPYSED